MQILSVDGILRDIWASLCQLIYKLIAFLYELFMNVAKVKLLTQDDIKPIYQRITLILAIVMVFYVSFEVVKYIISPDTITDKEKGASGVVRRMIIVVVLIAMVPTMFEKAYDVQNIIFENQLFSKILLGKQNTKMSSYGRTFAADLFGMFYYIDEDIWTKDDLDGECDDADCDMIVTLNLGMLSSTGEMPFIHLGLADEGETTLPGDVKERDMYYITFDGLLAVGVGIFVCWMLVMYTIDAGTRVAQLAFLQVIAPIPIIGYLSPKKDGIFQKWTKQCLSTYLDLFIRVSVIYFILLLCGILSNAYHDGTLFSNIENSSRTMEVFIYVALIMGLLAFAKRAPEMLKELFPKMSAASGSLGLNSKERVAPLAARALGMGLGATAGIRKMAAGGINAAKRNRMLKETTGKSARERAKEARDNKRAYHAAKKAYRKSRGADKETRQKLKDELVAAQSKHADAQSKKRKSIIGNAASGLITGTAVGAKTGFGAKEVGDIWKKGHKEAQAANQKSLNAKEEWLNAGGYSAARRFVSGVEQRMGVSTATARDERQIKTYEGQIKVHEALSKIESETKSSRDKVEDRLTSKMEAGELKRKLSFTPTPGGGGRIEGISEDLDIREGDTASTLHSRYKAKTEAAKQQLDRVMHDPTATDEARSQAQEEYAKAQRLESAVKKHAMRNIFTQVLQNVEAGTTHPDNDAVAVDMIKTMQTTIGTARDNPQTRAEFITTITKEIEAEEDSAKRAKLEGIKSAFESGRYGDYDTLDEVVVRLQNLSTERQRRVMELSESKRILETSDATAAHKADDSASKPQ